MQLINKTNQNILVIQELNKAESKIKWIKEYNPKSININIINTRSELPIIIDDSYNYLPNLINTDLVLDYLKHPDLSQDLAKICIINKIPIISSGKKQSIGKLHYIPKTCCSLCKSNNLGQYAKFFGKPELKITTKNGILKNVKVLRGAPCGSSWKASTKIIGTSIKEAAKKFALYIQYYCTAETSDWDAISGKSKIHIAAELHKTAINKSIDNIK